MNKKIKAFTLIELIIIVAILGVLSVTAIPTFINYFKKSKTAEPTDLDKLHPKGPHKKTPEDEEAKPEEEPLKTEEPDEEEEERKILKKYEEQLIPELDCYYKHFASSEEYKFILKNIGNVDIENIWIQEKIFLIIDDKVYEGEGVPHFNYLVYNNSREKMWDLAIDKEREIKLTEFQLHAFHKLYNQYNADIISKWKISYSKENAEKIYYAQKYFIFDLRRNTMA